MNNNTKCKLKKGDKLYRLLYYDWGNQIPHDREWSSFTVKEVKRNRIYVKGYKWSFSLSDLGDEVFKSKKELVEHTLKLYKELLKKEAEPIQKEIKYLEKKLLELKKVD